MSDDEQALQEILYSRKIESEKRDLNIHKKKIKVRVFSKKVNP